MKSNSLIWLGALAIGGYFLINSMSKKTDTAATTGNTESITSGNYTQYGTSNAGLSGYIENDSGKSSAGDNGGSVQDLTAIQLQSKNSKVTGNTQIDIQTAWGKTARAVSTSNPVEVRVYTTGGGSHLAQVSDNAYRRSVKEETNAANIADLKKRGVW